MAYKALYRTYRPVCFDDVIGQKHIIKILKNAVENNKTSHAYVFSGLRGIGKTTIARIFAKAVNCDNSTNGEPCNVCRNCLSIINNETTDVVELDAASNNGVDQMRDILEKVNFLPTTLSKKVYIIDEAHMLSTAAFNALLKTLEEPPQHVVFILATTEPYKIPATILSRCQRLDFKQLANDEIIKMITKISEKENINIEEDAKVAIAEASEGGMRDALSILDIARVYNSENITVDDIDKITGRVSERELIELIRALNEQDTKRALEAIDALIEEGKEVSRIIICLIKLCRDLLLYKSVEENTIEQAEEFVTLANETNAKRLFYYVDSLVDVQNKIRFTNSPKMFIEVGIIKIINNAVSDLEIMTRLQGLEEKISLMDPSSGVDSLNNVFNKIDSFENKFKKINAELDKNNFTTLKDAVYSKISVLEEMILKNKAIPLSVEEKLQELEEKIETPKQSEAVFVSDERIEKLENKIAELSQKDTTYLAKYDEEINAIKQKVETTSIPQDDLSGRINAMEEYLELVLEKVGELEKEKPQGTTSEEDIRMLFENYNSVIKKLNEIKFEIEQQAFDYPASKETSTALNYDSIYSVIDKKIIDTIDDFSQKIRNEHETMEVSVQEVKNNAEHKINELQALLHEKTSNLEQELSTIAKKLEENASSNIDSFITETNEKITEVKDYSVQLSAKLREVQNKVVEINTKLDGGITKRRSPFELVKEEKQEEVKTEVKEEKQEEVKVVEKPKEPAQISSSVYDVKIVERILTQAITPNCRKEKEVLIEKWPRLSERASYPLIPIANLLSQGRLQAVGLNEILIVYPQASMCNHLMEPKGHTQALQVLKLALGKEYDFIALPEVTWNEKRSEYTNQYGMGSRRIVLTPINNPELRINVVDTTSLLNTKNNSMYQAQSLFGKDLVKKEGD